MAGKSNYILSRLRRWESVIGSRIIEDATDEIDRLQDALRKTIKELEQSRIFVSSEEKHHPHGLELYDEIISEARAALSATETGGK